MNALLEAEDLETFYGRAQALFGVGLEVRDGEAVVLLGRNGAGKSTMLKTLAGLLRARTGKIRFAGERVDQLPTFQIVQRGLGYVPEDRRIFSELTVDENLEVGRRPAQTGEARWSPERLFALFPKLEPLRRRRGGFLSGGEQQMLAIARTLMGNPRLVLLDEPSEGLAPVIIEQVVEAIRALKRVGVSVLLSEQNLAFATAVADRAYAIESGHVRYEGPVRELLNDDVARRQWLSV